MTGAIKCGMTATDHAKFAPSSMHQVVNCAGSWKLQSEYPQSDDCPSALEGTAAHWVLSEALANRIHPVGILAPNGIAVTEEMHEGAEVFISNIPADVLGAGGCIHVENRVGPGAIHDDCWGTPDVWWIRDNVLNVADYKFGHSYVDAYLNWQMICYAAEILHMHPQLIAANIPVKLHICQPRCYSGEGVWRTWETTAWALEQYIARIKNAIKDALSGEVRCVTGRHCGHCSARIHCVAFQRSVSLALSVSHEADTSDLSPTALGVMRTMIADAQGVLKAMSGGLDEEIEALLRRGESVNGWQLQPGRGKTEWTVPVSEVIALGDMLGVPLGKEVCLTPIQAKSKGLDADTIAAYSKTTAGDLKVTQYDAGTLAKIFGG